MVVQCPQHGKQELSEAEEMKQLDSCRTPNMEWKCPIPQCEDLAHVQSD